MQPRYGQVTLDAAKMHNNLLQVVSPDQNADGVWTHQDTWFSLGNLENGFSTSYKLNKKGNGVYAFVIEGNVTINNQELNKRDGLGITETDELTITATTDATVLLMEVPMAIQ